MPDFAAARAFPLGGGLNLADAPETIPDGDALELVNVKFTGEGRWSPRDSMATVANLPGQICGIHSMPHGSDTASGSATGVVVLTHTGGRVDIYAADGKGRNAALVGTLAGWDSVSERPKTIAAVLGEALWIVDEGKLHGLTVYDPNERFEAGKLFQPLFKFESGLSTPAAPIRARTVAAFNNFLFVAGYGSEADPDRPEIVRFSYLGFEPDIEGGGDAGKDGAPIFGEAGYDAAAEISPGSAGLFDIEDVFGIGVRGQPVMSMVTAGARLLILTRFAAFILFGYDRFSFQADLLDNQRGCVASRAAGEANGLAFWYSPLGPTMWRGGAQAEGLERRITPLHRRINFDTIFFAHQPDEYEVRWYHSPDQGDPFEALEYNYLYDKFKTRELGTRVFCGGLTKPGTILTPGPGGDPLPEELDEIDPDMLPPEGVFVFPGGPHDAQVVWFNGETGPSITTELFLRRDDGEFSQVATLDSGVQTFVVDNLEAETIYHVRLWHRDSTTGRRSTSADTNFVTFGDDDFVAPQNFNVELRKESRPDGSPMAVAYVVWGLGQINSYTTVEFNRESTPTTTSIRNKDLNDTQHREPNIDLDTGPIRFRARHTEFFAGDFLGEPDGKVSAWTDWITVDTGSLV